MDLVHIVRQIIDEFAPVGSVGADDPEHKPVLRHVLYVLVHPGGHTAVDIGVAALQNQTDSHGSSSPSLSMVTLGASA